MKLVDLLTGQRVLLELTAGNCGEVIQELVGHLIAQGALDEEVREVALKALQCRENEISTGVGCGVAIPHAYLTEIQEPVAIYGHSSEGLDFTSCDNAPVHFVVLLLIPDEKRGQHLQTLADIGKRFLSSEIRQALAEAADEEAVLEILGR